MLLLLLLAQEASMKQALADLAAGKGDWSTFSATYDDLHGLHGGLRLTIHGSGKVEQKAVREPAGDPRGVSREQLVELIALLQKHEGWRQRVPERPAVPDESRARLILRVGGAESTIWEWHNDLAKNERLHPIREAMKRLAWTAPPK